MDMRKVGMSACMLADNLVERTGVYSEANTVGWRVEMMGAYWVVLPGF